MNFQNTIEKETSIEGIGIHSGKKVSMNFKPAPSGEGIVFKRTDLPSPTIVKVSSFESGPHKRRTVISKGGVEIHTIEHLMAALWAFSIDNILIEIDSEELPGLDGSAKDYTACLENAGIKKLEVEKKIIKIKEPLWCEKENAFIGIFPSQVFKVAYMLDSPSKAIGKQCLSIVLDKDSFCSEIAGARTFCLKEEAEALLKLGFGKGANTKNTLVMDENGPIDNKLRYADEPVRHKILDLIGDLYLTGTSVEGRVIGVRSGHDLNMELVKKIRSSYESNH